MFLEAHETVPDNPMEITTDTRTTPRAAEDNTAEATIAIRASRYGRMSFSLSILAAIALIASLYLARAFFVPLLIGILGSYTLHPLVDWLEAHYLPRALGAAIVLLSLVGGVGWVAYSLGDDAAAMIEKLPEAARKMRQTMGEARTEVNSPLQNMQEVANEIQGAASDAGLKTSAAKTARTTIVVRAAEPRIENSVWLRDYAVAQSALLITVLAQTPIVLLLAYFLLASGVHFRRKLVQFVGPSLSAKKDAVRILEEIDVQIQRYLLSTLLSNTLVGVGTWLAYEALGMEHAGVWGVAAGVLHFVPYLGSALVVVGSGVAAFLQFDSIVHGIAISGVAVIVAGGIGLVFMTWLQSRFARVNAAVLFIVLLFFAWLWGVWGLLLGAPLVAIIKVICDRIEGLKSVGQLLGH